MQIEVRLFMEYRKYLPPDASEGKTKISVDEGATINDVFKVLGIPVEEPKIIVLNGVSQGACVTVTDHVLREGDVIAIFPPVGGG